MGAEWGWGHEGGCGAVGATSPCPLPHLLPQGSLSRQDARRGTVRKRRRRATRAHPEEGSVALGEVQDGCRGEVALQLGGLTLTALCPLPAGRYWQHRKDMVAGSGTKGRVCCPACPCPCSAVWEGTGTAPVSSPCTARRWHVSALPCGVMDVWGGSGTALSPVAQRCPLGGPLRTKEDPCTRACLL